MYSPDLTQIHGKALCAVSGGADSVALLRFLVDEREKRHDIELYAIHVNHNLRGDESDADAAFVDNLCDRLNVPLKTVLLTPPDHPSEGWAREDRYRAILDFARELGASVVLAHHRRDQAETMLMHLMRGSGLNGLCGMRRSFMRDGVLLLRPLLDADPDELKQYLYSVQQDWREDSSNQGDEYLRNRVRHQLLPVLEDLSPGAVKRISEAAERLQVDEDALASLTDSWLSGHPGSILSLSDLPNTDSGLLSRILRSWCLREASLLPDAMHTA